MDTLDYLKEARQHVGTALKATRREDTQAHSSIAIAMALIALVERLDAMMVDGDSLRVCAVDRTPSPVVDDLGW